MSRARMTGHPIGCWTDTGCVCPDEQRLVEVAKLGDRGFGMWPALEGKLPEGQPVVRYGDRLFDPGPKQAPRLPSPLPLGRCVDPLRYGEACDPAKPEHRVDTGTVVACRHCRSPV